jgi:RNA-binding protein 39
LTYYEAEDARKAMEQMNGFELAGRPIKVGHVTEKPTEINVANAGNGAGLDYEELDR